MSTCWKQCAFFYAPGVVVINIVVGSTDVVGSTVGVVVGCVVVCSVVVSSVVFVATVLCSVYSSTFQLKWILIKRIEVADIPVKSWSIARTCIRSGIISTLCFKKRHPFYFCENLAKYYPISIIFGSNIPEEIIFEIFDALDSGETVWT